MKIRINARFTLESGVAADAPRKVVVTTDASKWIVLEIAGASANEPSTRVRLLARDLWAIGEVARTVVMDEGRSA